jgi:hypothetical protein
MRVLHIFESLATSLQPARRSSFRCEQAIYQGIARVLKGKCASIDDAAPPERQLPQQLLRRVMTTQET